MTVSNATTVTISRNVTIIQRRFIGDLSKRNRLTQLSKPDLLFCPLNGVYRKLRVPLADNVTSQGLAAYDLFPNFAVQPGQATLLTNPGSILVYVDSNTQQLNSDLLAVGSVSRFNGLVFNDNGILRMDCAQINDGVAE
jgi:hypothetical protein